MKKYDLLVFIGRFQPFHLGHKKVVEQAKLLSNNICILVGSSNRGRSLRNPFTFEERKQVIEASCRDENDASDLFVQPIDDFMYNDERWIEQVQHVVASLCKAQGLDANRVGLIGCEKDHSGYYLKLFPTWGHEAVGYFSDLDASRIRALYFTYPFDGAYWSDGIKGPALQDLLPPASVSFLRAFQQGDEYAALKDEDGWINRYRESVKQYPRIEQTVDAVVVQSGHILLVRRRAKPGKGLLALPGGFLHPAETQLDGAIRELREETRIDVPPALLRGSVKQRRTFDDPNRSARGRIITEAFHIALPRQKTLPKVKGGDDAAHAAWYPLSSLSPEALFEDHYFIIDALIGGI